MGVTWLDGRVEGAANYGFLEFDNPVLGGHLWPLIEIVGARPGPRLCVMAGLHVDEVSSIEAAVSLSEHLDAEQLSGVVSILPVVNIPARFVLSAICFHHRASTDDMLNNCRRRQSCGLPPAQDARGARLA